MKRLTILAVLVALVSMLASLAGPGSVLAGKPPACVTIQSGTLVDSVGNTIGLGYDQFGYNYQAHMFNGVYSDYDRAHGGLFSDVNLQMKWNDAWLSNKSCDADNKLDRHAGFASYIGSGAWLTNHDSGVNAAGGTWTHFIKIVAVPADATNTAGMWYGADGTEIGPKIWGEFAVIQQIITGDIPADFVAYDFEGIVDPYRSPSGPGLGGW